MSLSPYCAEDRRTERLREEDLVNPEKQHAFDGEAASVDVIAEEEIGSILWIAANLEELHEVVVLSVDVTAN